MSTTTPPPPPESTGGDVVAVGHEIGHLRADGTIIGRAEPYAKVFPSSRQVKRAVGVMAWAILEDIALDARIDDHGRLVAATNVRQIAANLGVSKNTVARHLTRLRDAGFVLHEEGNHDDSGRYTVSRYVLDPSACMERFTHTPSRRDTDDHDPDRAVAAHDTGDTAELQSRDDRKAAGTDQDVHNLVDNEETMGPAETSTADSLEPCTSSWDTVDATVSQSVGHRELGHKNEEVVVLREQPHRAREDTPGDPTAAQLVAAGVTPAKAAQLASRHPTRRIADVLDAVSGQNVDNPPGWITAALDGDWDINDLATQARDKRRRQRRQAARHAARQHADEQAAQHTQTQHERSQGWADLAAALLDDSQLTRLIEHLHDPRFPRSNRSVRLTTAQVTGWVAGACHRRGDRRPGLAITTALDNPTRIDPPDTLSAPPPSQTPALLLDRRIAVLLPLLDEGPDEQGAVRASSAPNREGEAA